MIRHTRQRGFLIWILETRWFPPAPIKMVSPGLEVITNFVRYFVDYSMTTKEGYITNLAADTADSMSWKTPGWGRSFTKRSTRSHKRGWHARYLHLWQTSAVLYLSANPYEIHTHKKSTETDCNALKNLIFKKVKSHTKKKRICLARWSTKLHHNSNTDKKHTNPIKKYVLLEKCYIDMKFVLYTLSVPKSKIF